MSSDSTFIGPEQSLAGQIIPFLVEPFVEAVAILVQDQIVAEINASSPGGRIYRIPGTRYRDGKKGTATKAGGRYQASAPGQAPAEREGIYRERWQHTPPAREGNQVVARVFNDATVGPEEIPLGAILEDGISGGEGESRMAPRPHIGPALQKAEPRINNLAKEAGW